MLQRVKGVSERGWSLDGYSCCVYTSPLRTTEKRTIAEEKAAEAGTVIEKDRYIIPSLTERWMDGGGGVYE